MKCREVEKSKVTYYSILLEKQFLKLSLAKWISRFGDAIDTVAFSWMIYKITNSSVMIAALYGVNSIPSILFSLIGGTAASYFKKKSIVFICDVGRGIVTLIVAVMFFLGYLRAWHLFVFTVMNSTFEAFRGPASTMLTKLSIPEEKLDYGISLESSVSNIIDLVGLGSAGFIIGFFGISGAVVIDAVTFLLCAFIIISMKVQGDKISKEKLNFNNYTNNFREGIKYFSKDKLILSISVLGAALMFMFVPFNSLMSPYVDEVLEKGPEALSIIGITLTIGTILGSILFGVLKSRFKSRYIFIVGGILIGAGYSCVSFLGLINNYKYLYVVLGALVFIMGIGIPLFNIPISVALMRNVEEEYIPRVTAIFNTMALCATPLGAMICGIMISVIPITTLYLICGAAVSIMILGQIFNRNLNKL